MACFAPHEQVEQINGRRWNKPFAKGNHRVLTTKASQVKHARLSTVFTEQRSEHFIRLGQAAAEERQD